MDKIIGKVLGRDNKRAKSEPNRLQQVSKPRVEVPDFRKGYNYYPFRGPYEKTLARTLDQEARGIIKIDKNAAKGSPAYDLYLRRKAGFDRVLSKKARRNPNKPSSSDTDESFASDWSDYKPPEYQAALSTQRTLSESNIDPTRDYVDLLEGLHDAKPSTSKQTPPKVGSSKQPVPRKPLSSLSKPLSATQLHPVIHWKARVSRTIERQANLKVQQKMNPKLRTEEDKAKPEPEKTATTSKVEKRQPERVQQKMNPKLRTEESKPKPEPEKTATTSNVGKRQPEPRTKKTNKASEVAKRRSKSSDAKPVGKEPTPTRPKLTVKVPKRPNDDILSTFKRSPTKKLEHLPPAPSTAAINRICFDYSTTLNISAETRRSRRSDIKPTTSKRQSKSYDSWKHGKSPSRTRQVGTGINERPPWVNYVLVDHQIPEIVQQKQLRNGGGFNQDEYVQMLMNGVQNDICASEKAYFDFVNGLIDNLSNHLTQNDCPVAKNARTGLIETHKKLQNLVTLLSNRGIDVPEEIRRISEAEECTRPTKKRVETPTFDWWCIDTIYRTGFSEANATELLNSIEIGLQQDNADVVCIYYLTLISLAQTMPKLLIPRLDILCEILEYHLEECDTVDEEEVIFHAIRVIYILKRHSKTMENRKFRDLYRRMRKISDIQDILNFVARTEGELATN